MTEKPASTFYVSVYRNKIFPHFTDTNYRGDSEDIEEEKKN